MRPSRLFFLLLFAGLFVLTFSAAAQDTDSVDMDMAANSDSGMGVDFGLGLLLGVETFDPAVEGGSPETYQTLALKPDLEIGPFGIGIDLVLHYRFGADTESGFEIRKEDWIPQPGQTILELYLPKIKYIRWGHKGDSLFIKAGQIEDASLGTGFIVNNYSNTIFQPDEKVMGLSFDIDGRLFNFPYLGIETFAGNLAHFDVFGARLYTRPILWSGIPVLKNLELGVTAAADIDPDYRPEFYHTDLNGTADAGHVLVMGTDLILPVINFDIMNLALFGDFVLQNKNMGGMAGLGGRLFNIIPYIFQIRIIGDNFIPSYFDSTYDLYRGVKYHIYNSPATTFEGSISWLASTGFSILDDLIIFNLSADGPFSMPPSGDVAKQNYLEYPHVNAFFKINNGLIPGFSFSAAYDKKYIKELEDFIKLQNSMMNLGINYNAGAAVLSFTYNLVYIKDKKNDGFSLDDFDVSSSISCSINFF